MRSIRGRRRVSSDIDRTSMTNAPDTVNQQTQTDENRLVQQLQDELSKTRKQLNEEKTINEVLTVSLKSTEAKLQQMKKAESDMKRDYKSTKERNIHLTEKLNEASKKNDKLRQEIRDQRLVIKGLEYDNVRLEKEREPSFNHFVMPDQNRLIVEMKPENSDVPEHISLVFPKNPQHVYRTYSLDEVVGKGAFGKVYLAIVNCNSPNIKNECCAVKVIDKGQLCWQKNESDKVQYKRRFQAEMDIQSRLSHDHIVHMTGSYQNDKFLINELELCKYDLHEFMERQPDKRLSLKLAYHVAKDLFAAISYLHQSSILHRDIKPRNLLLKQERPTLKWALGDFGCAIDVNVEEVGHSVGTQEYLPDDVSSNKVQHSRATDVYSCGMTLYKGLTRQFPNSSHANEVPDNDKDSTWRVINSCLAKKSDDRPTAKEALEFLPEAASEVIW